MKKMTKQTQAQMVAMRIADLLLDSDDVLLPAEAIEAARGVDDVTAAVWERGVLLFWNSYEG